MSGALQHLRVIELGGGVAAPYCGKLFAAYGARVSKIEPPPDGDPTRSTGPFAGEPGIETSIPFLWLNTSKESVALDLSQTAGQALARRIALTADIVIESSAPGHFAGTGLAYDELAAEHPGLIMVSVTPFGQDGPYRGFLGDEIVAYATGGGMHLTGDPDREPLAGGPQVAHCSAGMAAYIGALAAVYGRQLGGRGRWVDVSIQEAMLDNIEIALVENLHNGQVARRKGDQHTLVPWQLYPCRDGWAAVIGGPIRNWLGAVEMFDEPRLEAPEYRHVAGRMARRTEFETLMQPWLDRHDRKEILTEGRRRGLAFGVLNHPEEVLEHPHHRERGFFHRLEHPTAGEHVVAGEPFRVAGAPAVHRRAPLLGEHTEEVLTAALGLTGPEVAGLIADGVVHAASEASP